MLGWRGDQTKTCFMRHPLSRRNVLALSLAATVARPVNAATQNPDVVIVGAGVAGLAAARVLTAGGRSVMILEASPRIGGHAEKPLWRSGAARDPSGPLRQKRTVRLSSSMGRIIGVACEFDGKVICLAAAQIQ